MLNAPPSPPMLQTRLNLRDIPCTYSGLYGMDGDLVPFELSQRPSRTFSGPVFWILLALYTTFLIVVLQWFCFVLALLKIDLSDSWTWTNVLHGFLSILQVHWIKGSMYFLDDATNGELNGYTLWEQLEATPDTRLVRETLMVVPCLLTWVACHAVDYHKQACLLNVVVWMATMLAKLPCMNGVRLFGINRTAGIDDNTTTAVTMPMTTSKLQSK